MEKFGSIRRAQTSQKGQAPQAEGQGGAKPLKSDRPRALPSLRVTKCVWGMGRGFCCDWKGSQGSDHEKHAWKVREGFCYDSGRKGQQIKGSIRDTIDLHFQITLLLCWEKLVGSTSACN